MNSNPNEMKAARKAIGGWLVLPVAILWFNLVWTGKILLEVVNRPPNSRIIYPALGVDIVVGVGCLFLIRLIQRRSPLFPSRYIAFNLLIFVLWTLAILLADVGAYLQWMAIGVQSLFLTPYILKSRRVQETFIAGPGGLSTRDGPNGQSALDGLNGQSALDGLNGQSVFSDRLLGWWRRRGVLVIFAGTLGFLVAALALIILLKVIV